MTMSKRESRRRRDSRALGVMDAVRSSIVTYYDERETATADRVAFASVLVAAGQRAAE